MCAIFDPSSRAPYFTARVIEGPSHAPRVVFLDPINDPAENTLDRVTSAIEQYGEVVFAIHRYGITEGYRRLGKFCLPVDLPEFGAPDIIRLFGKPIHSVFAATFPPLWETGQVRGYALSSSTPTMRYGMLAQQWLAEIGPSASNRLLWSACAS